MKHVRILFSGVTLAAILCVLLTANVFAAASHTTRSLNPHDDTCGRNRYSAPSSFSAISANESTLYTGQVTMVRNYYCGEYAAFLSTTSELNVSIEAWVHDPTN